MKRIQKRAQSDIAFEARSKEGPLVKTTRAYWNVITNIKHPSVKGKEKYVIETIVSPDEIRLSKKDRNVHLFYKRYKHKYLCVISRVHKDRGFIITAYYTQKIKEGELKWRR